ncbi:MAG: phycobilisome protein [Leptolyngbya sp. SIO4C1]|nr:phycobilisome protein [Leptolyngbya sp. SIO4C1]
MTPLSPEIKALIAKARIVSFADWQADYSAETLAQLQAADDQGRYLTDAELAELPGAETARLLRDRATEIVDEARQQVLEQFPEITQPGGGLYPAVRAEACWRDFWHFLRCVTYGIAAERTDYLSQTGLHHMEQLYQALQVPLEAMVVGLKGLKAASLKRVTDPAPYFDQLIDALVTFRA